MSQENYNLQQFAEVVVKKTLLVKESHFENITHMLLGMGSEYNSELTMASISGNFINKQEELGDMEFFVVGLMIFENMFIPEEAVINDYHRMINPSVLIEKSMGDIFTIYKKELTSGVKKLDGVVVTPEMFAEKVNDLLAGISLLCKRERMFLQSGIRPMIRKKLNVRYAGGGFDAEKSLNRDTEKELAVMSDPMAYGNAQSSSAEKTLCSELVDGKEHDCTGCSAFGMPEHGDVEHNLGIPRIVENMEVKDAEVVSNE